MGKEIERKYLVDGDGWRKQAGEGVLYRQGYLSEFPERTVRVRVAAEKAFLTIKGKSTGAARDEFEYPIPREDAEAMLEHLCIKPLIEKRRYKVRRGALTWEVDEFSGENEGLIVAEVEMDSEDQEIEEPEWAGKQVTDDPRYFNLNLVHHPFSKWKGKEGA